MVWIPKKLGLEEGILWFIAAPKQLKKVSPGGESKVVELKKEDGKAETEEIKRWVDERGWSCSDATLYRKLGSLREKRFIIQEKRNLYVITEKGREHSQEKSTIHRGRAFLNKYAEPPVWLVFELTKKDFDFEYLDLHIRFCDRQFIGKLVDNLKKWVPGHLQKVIQSENGSFTIAEETPQLGTKIQDCLLLHTVELPELIGMLRDGGYTDECIDELLDLLNISS